MRISKNRNVFTGELRIANCSCGGESYVVFELDDLKYGARLIDIQISRAQLGEALMGGRVEPETTLYPDGIEVIGFTHQYKTQFVPGETSYNSRKEDAQLACKPFEVDGWTARHEDFGNHHRHREIKGVKGYNIDFHRFVKIDPE